MIGPRNSICIDICANAIGVETIKSFKKRWLGNVCASYLCHWQKSTESKVKFYKFQNRLFRKYSGNGWK